MLRLLLATGLCLLGAAAFAQNPLSGRLTDASDEPLIGATVLVEGTTVGTVTDLDGRYALEVPAGAERICFSYVGAGGPECIAYTGQASLDWQLTGGIDIGEVVVTALGLRRENAELGYALQQIDAREIADVPATNFLDNLAGQVAGVNVVSGPTGVGSSSLVSIRGEASFGINTPLYVVDGVPIDNRAAINVTDELAAGFQEVDFGGGTPEVSPYDVASVTVLKGPAAAALYGTRAANGVLIITTKPGGAEEGLGVEINSQTTFERPFRLPEFQNEFGQGRSGAFAYVDGAGAGVNDGITFSYGPRLDVGVRATQFDSPVRTADGRTVRAGDLALYDRATATVEETPFASQPDNLANLYQTGVTTLNNVALSQGFRGGDYRLSFTDLRSESYLPGVNLMRNNLAARLRFQPLEAVEVSAGVTYVNSRSDNRPASGYGSENLNYSMVAWLGRSTKLEPLRDYWQPGLEGRRQFTFNTSFFDNPFFILNENRNSFERDRLFGYLQAAVKLSPKLELRLRTGLDDQHEDRRLRRAFSSNRWADGAYAENAVNFQEHNTDLLLTYEDEIGRDVSFRVSGGANRLDQTADVQQTQAEALSSPGIYRLSNAAVPLVTFGQETRRRINSAYGLLSVGWRDQAYADLTGRNDWSSALATPDGRGEVSFFYPSVGLSWLAHKTLRLPASVSYVQLRGSFAQVGNDTDPYRTAGAFVPSTPVNGAPAFTDQLEIPATGLRPEIATAFEAGADVRLFDDMLGLDLTAYTQLNEDQILALPTPISSGYESRVVNGGAVRATGVEAVLSVRGLRLGPVGYEGRVNFNTARATVESLPAGVDQTTIAYSRVYNNPGQTVYYIAEEGGRIGDMYGTSYLRNEAGEYVVAADGNFIADNTLRKLGNYNPDFQVGLQNGFTFRRLRLDFLLDWRQGGEVVSRTQALAGYSGQLAETALRPEEGIIVPGVMNMGTPEAPDYVPNETAISPEAYYIQFYNREHEEHNTLDATFVKLREVQLSYRFDALDVDWLQALDVALVGRNLAAWSPGIVHFDPEQFAVQGQRFVRGVEDMSYPTPRSLGVKISARL